VRDTGPVTTKHQIRFEGPSALAVKVATELATADGIDLTSSKPPKPLDGETFVLEVTVEGTGEVVAAAVEQLREGLPAGASITVVSD
jgi:hypothetical protein